MRSSCNKKIRVLPNLRFIAILITPVFAAHIFVLKPSVIAIGFSGKGMVGIWIALLIILTMQLKSAESQ